MEFDAARWAFHQLGAGAGPGPGGGAGPARGRRAAGLTARELEVLPWWPPADEPAIAAELVISEKTVARHVSNIFTKLGLSSRAAATARLPARPRSWPDLAPIAHAAAPPSWRVWPMRRPAARPILARRVYAERPGGGPP